jgi:hypothetical protein
MNVDTAQIDHIVREVMRRLSVMDRDDSRDTPASRAAASAERLSLPPQTLLVTERVVTMASLSGRLAGVKRVQVSPAAIVTPLVADALREQGIGLERQPARAGNATPISSTSIELVADAVETRRVATLLDEIAGASWKPARAGDVCSAIAGGESNRRVIVLTADWASVVCRANRRGQVRAAVANCVATVNQACQQLDANVLVIDSTRLTDTQLHDVVRQYVQYLQQAPASS